MTLHTTLHKDLRVLVRRACRNGWWLDTSCNHLKLRKGTDMIVIGGSMSDRRAITKVRAEMRRKGAA